ncbi:MAG: Asp-tRNA(Asn)/Glu-tRNA(Gln) amidotransferase subunit GatB [Patescibacteria group bacterium]
MTKYIPTIGLEIHAELATRTKMFCACANNTDEKIPNTNVCPVCMGHPGTLPVINKQAVKLVLKMGAAAGGKLADFTEFDRKNYFYPDIPKGYQISQYKYPLVQGGEIDGVALTRIHLEEDTAKSTHDTGADSLVDFNRAGLPLMELVTEPVIHDAQTASRFAKELQLLLQSLGAGEANMEKGEMRVEANISIAPEGATKFGTKVEVKNLNSFRAVERAIAYEIARHTKILDAAERAKSEGGAASVSATAEKIVQETRGWDEKTQSTFSQRAKEDSHDYRYFPDPDLPKLYISEISEFSLATLKAELPELPWQKRERYQKVYGLTPKEAEMLVGSPEVGAYFEAILAGLAANGTATSGAVDPKSVKLAANYLLSDYIGLLKAAAVEGEISVEMLAKIAPTAFSELLQMIANGKLSSRAAKDIIAIMYAEGGTPQVIADARGLIQKNDEGELKKIMAEVIAQNAKAVADYRAGKAAALQSLVGQGMKATKGGANPEILKKITLELLGA